MTTINRKALLVSATGGKLDIVNDDGELLASVAVPAGKVPVLPYLELVPEGAELQVSEGLALFEPRHRIGIQPYGPGSHDSGANPDFRPTSASRFEREMRTTLARLQAHEQRVDAKLRALSTIERVPHAPGTGDVIEKPEPQPEAKPAPAADAPSPEA